MVSADRYIAQFPSKTTRLNTFGSQLVYRCIKEENCVKALAYCDSTYGSLVADIYICVCVCVCVVV